ncbi:MULTISPECIES: hypothetical protein [Streptomyces]|uniref:hypothetical protein n=1 Tax=Streptomyces TaxID=1883 RepID=UPI00163BA18D|nr:MULTISPECIES: hypothetical protein [Streptomyces]MBC2876821.1 hypothetical protein [Streptomyces sp. TYQ1024]UBI36443.1 hypothetical protein K7I03_08170 [Streptomyces mobaraensis]UKW29035.1 hypothetical protein MCU78_08155 [Streptomyces sp. TYQ1024]
MDEHPVIRFTNELMVVSELDQRAAGAFVRSVYQEGAREGEQRVIVELHRRDRRIAELEGELARLRGEDGETAG